MNYIGVRICIHNSVCISVDCSRELKVSQINTFFTRSGRWPTPAARCREWGDWTSRFQGLFVGFGSTAQTWHQMKLLKRVSRGVGVMPQGCWCCISLKEWFVCHLNVCALLCIKCVCFIVYVVLCTVRSLQPQMLPNPVQEKCANSATHDAWFRGECWKHRHYAACFLLCHEIVLRSSAAYQTRRDRTAFLSRVPNPPRSYCVPQPRTKPAEIVLRSSAAYQTRFTETLNSHEKERTVWHTKAGNQAR